jgi:hypothetical protein
MIPDAEAVVGALQATEHDPRASRASAASCARPRWTELPQL